MNEKTTELKRASKWGVIFYSCGDLASQFVWTFIGSYLTVFYTDIVGLAPAAVAAIMMIARIWDAVNDPMMGAVAERTRTKFGRFRPYLLFGSPLLAISSVICFTHPFSGTSTAGVIFAAVTYIITGMLYTLVNIPYGALAAVMTEDADQRNMINASRNVGMNIGILVVNGLTAGIMLYFSGEGAEVANGNGYFMTSLVYAIISIPCFLAVFFTSKERVMPETRAEKFSLRDTLHNLVTNKYLMILLVIMILQMTAWMGRISVVIYYIMYCLGSFSLIPVIMLAPSVCGIISSLLIPKVIAKFGKKRTLQVAVLCQAVALLAMYFTPYDNLTLIVIESGLAGFFNVSFPCSLSLLGDAIDYYEYETGVRSDGVAYATYGLATKLGNAIGASVGVLLLAAFGYVANVQQTPEAMHGINMVVNLFPAIIFVLTALFACTWRLSENEANDIRKKLHERKSAE